MMAEEAQLIHDKHLLLCYDINQNRLPAYESEEFSFIKRNFCGKLCSQEDFSHPFSAHPDLVIYLCGDVAAFRRNTPPLPTSSVVKVIKDFSYDYSDDETLITAGQIPLNIHNAGIYVRDFFGSPSRDLFGDITSAHQFQILTESNKPSSSHRKGIYLSEVSDAPEGECGGTEFNLLRCSTNLEGPTDAFDPVDSSLLEDVNRLAERFFDRPAQLNHVLAQVYENFVSTVDGRTKERKARIKRHSDKTKDMPRNGLIAFCTFYSKDVEEKGSSRLETDPFDRMFKHGSVLTRLRFRSKDPELDARKEFTLTLYPNSVFLIPLSTNRLYTHEIVPPELPIGKIPTRLGYVIRCSDTRALHKDGRTFIKSKDQTLVPLRKPTAADVAELKDAYYRENVSTDIITYGDVHYSLNDGDYCMPTKNV